MKKVLLTCFFVAFFASLYSQSCYWVIFADKNGTDFDPYSYFDEKAIQRYNATGADLYHISNYPLNHTYVNQVSDMVLDVIGESRWFNALAVEASESQMDAVRNLSFVSYVKIINCTDMQLAQQSYEGDDQQLIVDLLVNDESNELYDDQLMRMQGNLFGDNGYDGKGIRIAVFDSGFPSVDTHLAFEHLRSGKQIIATWNFPEKKADVYGWGSHGTNTLSCIAGVAGGKKLGLATGAEYLLARTEVNLEPFKEEIWWMQAVEWADKHGANIISSSLGYGKDRYFTTDMDGTSFVAKAANMAARKGILVCNSAGNEGDDNKWKTIITPADADSVLCVGGISRSLTEYEHISFSSFGPSADGRLKPNVVAFGQAKVANHARVDQLRMVFGTSFSCPLVAGFAACAWQASPGKTAMEMLKEIEKSSDLYPYFDYAFGYGVPQASYFVENGRSSVSPTFVFEQNDSVVIVRPIGKVRQSQLFFNLQNEKGALDEYQVISISDFDSNTTLRIYKSSLYKRTLNVSLNGYTSSFRLTDDQAKRLEIKSPSMPLLYSFRNDGDAASYYEEHISKSAPFNHIPKKTAYWSHKLFFDYGFSWGTRFSVSDIYAETLNLSDKLALGHTCDLGFRSMRAITKRYLLGFALSWNPSSYRLSHRADGVEGETVVKSNLFFDKIRAEVMQRVVFIPGGSSGFSWDLGIYGSVVMNHVFSETNYFKGHRSNRIEHQIHNPSFPGFRRWEAGVTSRFNYAFVGLFVRARLSDLLAPNDVANTIQPSLLEVGLSFTL